jgi:ABC-type Na+ efflux pump permease subunit
MTAFDTVKLITAREIKVKLRDKTFLFSTAFFLLFAIASTVLPAVLGGGPSTVATADPTAAAMVRQAGLKVHAVTDDAAVVAGPKVLGPAIGWFVPFFVLGFVMLATLWAGVGALAARQEDIGGLSMPLQMAVLLPFFRGGLPGRQRTGDDGAVVHPVLSAGGDAGPAVQRRGRGLGADPVPGAAGGDHGGAARGRRAALRGLDPADQRADVVRDGLAQPYRRGLKTHGGTAGALNRRVARLRCSGSCC